MSLMIYFSLECVVQYRIGLVVSVLDTFQPVGKNLFNLLLRLFDIIGVIGHTIDLTVMSAIWNVDSNDCVG